MKPKHDSLGRSSELKTCSHKNLYMILYQEEEVRCLSADEWKTNCGNPYS